jgi:hypothetical protein
MSITIVCVCVSVRACVCVVVFALTREHVHILARVALFIQHATCMLSIILPSAASLAPPYFSTLSHKRHDLRKTF